MSRRGVLKFLHHYEATGTILRKPGSGRPTKITMEVKRIVDEQMIRDDETSAVQLHALLATRGYKISLATILRCRSALIITCSSTHITMLKPTVYNYFH